MNVYDCFRILELPRNAGLDDLKCAYRSKAKVYHPDKRGGDGLKFALLHEAYTFLLDYGQFKSGTSGEEMRRRNEEAAARSREAARRAEAEKQRHEAEKARKKREEELKALREKRLRREREKREAEKKAAEKARKNHPEHRAHLAGEILAGRHSDREKLRALDSLVSLKRKSVYPYLKKAFYGESEKVTIAAIHAVGHLNIIQAGPELTSLMCSGSDRIRLAVLEALGSFRNPAPYKTILEMALSDKSRAVRKKAKELAGAFHE